MKTLVVLAHPRMDGGSIANRIIVDRIRPLEGVTIRDLYRECPTFTFDVEAEQQALVEHGSIIFQFPFYWYSVPGIMKEWLDRIFTYGFAYGSAGNKLQGKDFLVSTTIGGPEEAYCAEGFNNFTVSDLLKPLRNTASLTGMTYHEPILSYSMVYIPDVYNVKEEVEGRARDHAERLAAYITG